MQHLIDTTPAGLRDIIRKVTTTVAKGNYFVELNAGDGVITVRPRNTVSTGQADLPPPRDYQNAELQARHLKLCKVHGKFYREDAAHCASCEKETVGVSTKG